MTVYDLKSLFELRKIPSTTNRISAGRVFFAHGKMGIKDHSTALWPVAHSHETSALLLKEGAWIQFVAENPWASHVLHITKMTDHVVCRDLKYTVFSEDERYALFDPSVQKTQYIKLFTATKQKNIIQRNLALQRTMDFFVNRNFIHMKTPILVPSGGMESYLSPFQTSYEDQSGTSWNLELPTSPELALKKILVEGFPKIFQLAPSFRNKGELSHWHEPEFIMLEWYRAQAKLEEILQDTEQLVSTLADFLGSNLKLPRPWPTFRVDFLFQQLLGLDLTQLQNRHSFYHAAKSYSSSLVESDTWDHIFCKLFMEKIEPYLKEQTACFVTHYPIQMGALAAQEKNKPFVQRAEAFLSGIEICNAYQELQDVTVLMERFQTTKILAPNVKMDPVFFCAMERGLPYCAGNALGIERVVAVLLGFEKIQTLLPLGFSENLRI